MIENQTIIKNKRPPAIHPVEAYVLQNLVPGKQVILNYFRKLNEFRYPFLSEVTRDKIYDDGRMMAPGGLLLAKLMADKVSVREGMRILDIGCGLGQSSVFLAKQFNCDIVSLDLYVDVNTRRKIAEENNVANKITMLQGDIRKGLPAGMAHFDLIFCMQAFHSFGTHSFLLEYLATLLNPKGRICIAQTCFNKEFSLLPAVYQNSDGWNTEYQNYHSPEWWRKHFEKTNQFFVTECSELIDGDVMWEDHVLYHGEKNNWSPDFMNRFTWLLKQLLFGKIFNPYLTHMLLTARKLSSD